MDTTLKLPVGIEDFQEIRRLGFYYIDKTKLIEQLLEQWGKVNLFTRPRRFGKTLNMSMLRCFFEIGTDKTLFVNLYISKRKDFCENSTNVARHRYHFCPLWGGKCRKTGGNTRTVLLQ